MEPSTPSFGTPGTPEQPAPMPPQPVKRSKKPLMIALLIVVVALAVGLTMWLTKDNSQKDKKGATVTNGIVNGTFRYANACQVFTSDDVQAIEGKPADTSSISGSYGTDFPAQTSEDTAFKSDCTRSPQQDQAFALTTVYTVTIDQYASLSHNQQSIKNPPQLGSTKIDDPSIVPKFGTGAFLNRNVLNSNSALLLTFYYQNKDVSVGVTSPPGKPDAALQSKTISLGEKVLARLKANNLDASKFVLGPSSGQVAGKKYVSPCGLLTPQKVSQAVGMPVDATNIGFTYAEEATHNTLSESANGGTVYNTLSGTCTYTVKPATGKKFTLDVKVQQSLDNAALETLTRTYKTLYTTDVKIEGIGQAAKVGKLFGATDPEVKKEAKLLAGYPYVLVTIDLNGYPGAEAQKTAAYQKLAKQLPASLPQ